MGSIHRLLVIGSHLAILRDTLIPTQLDANHDYGSAQCSRMALDAAGIAGGWKVEYMPEPRRECMPADDLQYFDMFDFQSWQMVSCCRMGKS